MVHSLQQYHLISKTSHAKYTSSRAPMLLYCCLTDQLWIDQASPLSGRGKTISSPHIPYRMSRYFPVAVDGAGSVVLNLARLRYAV
jgi:hypothetical protein